MRPSRGPHENSGPGRIDAQAIIDRRYGLPYSATPEALRPQAARGVPPAAVAALTGLPTPEGMSPPQLLTLAPPGPGIRVMTQLTYGLTRELQQFYAALGGDAIQRWHNFVDYQLDWTAIDDGAVRSRLLAAGYTTLDKPLSQLWADHVAPNPEYAVRMRPANEVARAALVRAVHSRRQLLEVLVLFWHDHFNVTISDYDAGPVYMHYDRDVIRPHATGNFRTLLEAMAKSTAMMYYLDNRTNRRTGPNENFARELLELHTLGARHYYGFMPQAEVPRSPVDPLYPDGYTDIDVYEVAKAFTGWTIASGSGAFPDRNDGTFLYWAPWHDGTLKSALGIQLPAGQPDMKDGQDILDRLASHPATASTVCEKLVRRFIGDRPPPALVASAAAIFRQNWQHPRQIELTLRHILHSDALLNSWGQKARRPFEAIAAALRATGSDWTPAPDDKRSNDLFWLLGLAGHVPMDWPAPNGYPDVAMAWSGPNTHAMDWRNLHWLTEAKADGTAVPLLPILAASRSDVPSWTARALTEYWCRRLLGYLPAPARLQLLVAFLAQNGNPDTDVIADTDAWAGSDLKKHYNQQRIRATVALILSSPEFITR